MEEDSQVGQEWWLAAQCQPEGPGLSCHQLTGRGLRGKCSQGASQLEGMRTRKLVKGHLWLRVGPPPTSHSCGHQVSATDSGCFKELITLLIFHSHPISFYSFFKIIFLLTLTVKQITQGDRGLFLSWMPAVKT